MLPTYVAFKKNYNYYYICETVPSGTENNMQIYRLIPKANDTFTVTSISERNNYEEQRVLIQRTTRTAPYRHNYRVTFEDEGKELVLINETNNIYYVPILKGRNTENFLGKRWSEVNTDYFFSINADNRDISILIDTLINIGKRGKQLINFGPNSREVHQIGVQRPSNLLQENVQGNMQQNVQQRELPNFVIRGWLLNTIREEGQCPITFETLTRDNTAFTPCYHIISYNAAETWLAEHHTCPVCRERCELNSLTRFSYISA